MFPSDWIKFFDLHLIGHSTLILVCRVKMTGISRRIQSDFISHLQSLYIGKFKRERHLREHRQGPYLSLTYQ